MSEEHWADESSEGNRRRLADDLVKCRFVMGMSKKDVLRLLGLPPDGALDIGDGTYALDYPLGPDELGIDSDTLYVNFSRSDRVESVEIGGS